MPNEKVYAKVFKLAKDFCVKKEKVKEIIRETEVYCRKRKYQMAKDFKSLDDYKVYVAIKKLRSVL